MERRNALTEISKWFIDISIGDRNAFELLYQYYWSKLCSFATQLLKDRLLAEEAVSDLFVNIWLRRESLNEIASPQLYLYGALRNICLNELRRKSLPSKSITDESELDLQYNALDPAQLLVDKELNKLLDAAVDTLPEQRKLIFSLLRDEGLKQKEVAELMQLSLRTVENQMFRAVKYLTAYIETYLEKESKQQGKIDLKRFFIFF